ncbi:MAG: hypothetical protein K5683_08855 [Prevotella sp.]|nr:hypothetical protein [Prevotella sp.]
MPSTSKGYIIGCGIEDHFTIQPLMLLEKLGKAKVRVPALTVNVLASIKMKAS